jgi:hypothetical protein
MCRSASACRECPIQRIRTERTPVTPGGGQQGGLGLVDQLRVDGVHEPPVDVADRGAQHAQNGHGDHQSDDRVGEREAGRDAASADQDGGEPVAGRAPPARR